jgi:ABC-2 type transport system ATP-binding protein
MSLSRSAETQPSRADSHPAGSVATNGPGVGPTGVKRRQDAETAAAGGSENRDSASAAVRTIELRKEYRGGTTALRGLSMTVKRGEVFGFLGPNGAGKTTAVKLLLGLIRPTGGEAMVLGSPAGDLETRRRIGYLPELFRYQSWLKAREVLALHCKLLQLPKRAHMENIDRCLQVVGLHDRGEDKVGTFSKGMQQRLGLGVALLGEPSLVILDEPTSALDPVGRHDVRGIIRDLRASGTTVFLNTHLLEEAEQVCDRVTVIDHGRSIASGSLGELLGDTSRLRLNVKGLARGWWNDLAPTVEAGATAPLGALGRFSEQDTEGEWVTVDQVKAERTPEIVARIVAMGGLVEAVIPEHRTLEQRFLELLGEP